MEYFVHQGKVYAYAEAQERAFVMQDNGWANPVYWTWQEITPRDFQIIREIAERECRHQAVIDDQFA